VRKRAKFYLAAVSFPSKEERKLAKQEARIAYGKRGFSRFVRMLIYQHYHARLARHAERKP